MTPAVIARDDAEEYIRIHAQHASLEKQLEELKKKILPQLVAGAVSPSDLPCLLVNRPQERKQSDWKGFARELLVKLKRSEAKAAIALEKKEREWTVKTTPALHVIINPEFFEKKPA